MYDAFIITLNVACAIVCLVNVAVATGIACEIIAHYWTGK